jgi:hypothetical protein
VEIVKRRDAFERDPEGFSALWEKQEDATRRKIVAARKRLNDVSVPDTILERAAALCIHLKTDGLRGQLTMMRAARALAAFEGAKETSPKSICAAWPAFPCAIACAATRWMKPDRTRASTARFWKCWARERGRRSARPAIRRCALLAMLATARA